MGFYRGYIGAYWGYLGIKEKKMETTIQDLGFRCRPLINRPLRLGALNIRMPIIIPIKGRGFINQGSGVVEGLGGNLRRLVTLPLPRSLAGSAHSFFKLKVMLEP